MRIDCEEAPEALSGRQTGSVFGRGLVAEILGKAQEVAIRIKDVHLSRAGESIVADSAPMVLQPLFSG
jgi:hypothetical protein